MEPRILIGQILGVIVVLISFASYQAKTQKGIVIINLIATLVNATHYLLLGSYLGALLNSVCIIRNVVYYYKDKKIFSSRAVPYVMAAVIAVVAAFSWEGYITLVLAGALMINTVMLSCDNPQTVRRSILLTSTMILIYNIVLGSVGGCANEIVAISSAIIGLVRYRTKKTEENT